MAYSAAYDIYKQKYKTQIVNCTTFTHWNDETFPPKLKVNGMSGKLQYK